MSRAAGSPVPAARGPMREGVGSSGQRAGIWPSHDPGGRAGSWGASGALRQRHRPVRGRGGLGASTLQAASQVAAS